MAQIKKKGFNMALQEDNDLNQVDNFSLTDFSRMRGIKSLTDAVYKLGDLYKATPTLANKVAVLQAIHRGDITKMRQISNFFYKASGIYQRLCRYMAYMYRYDWFVTPYYTDKTKSDKIVDKFKQILTYLDNFNAKRFFGEIALKVMRNGCYYGYLIFKDNRIMVQQLPIPYCRSRFSVNDQPVIEFNMRYFDDAFSTIEQRNRILEVFPAEFAKAYKLYKQNKLTAELPGEENGWYVLEIGSAIKFNLNGDDFPPFISVIPAIIDLDQAQALDKKKLQQQLLKIIIQ